LEKRELDDKGHRGSQIELDYQHTCWSTLQIILWTHMLMKNTAWIH